MTDRAGISAASWNQAPGSRSRLYSCLGILSSALGRHNPVRALLTAVGHFKG